MIQRSLSAKLHTLAGKYQVITLTGPRQSGKTTLVKHIFPNLPYVSLEDPDIRQFALTDPRGFLSNYPAGAVLDEVQRTPDLFSYIQTQVDSDRNLLYVLTGSSNFLLMETISQTLAGRTAVLNLLPFSMEELPASHESTESVIFKGHYPRVYDRELAPEDFYPAYIQTYIEKDVRLMKNIGDSNAFMLFVRLCAGRTGQLLNYSSLASDAGISPNTVKAWLSILESSFIVYRLQPHYINFSKRLVKSPKLYFYDTGVACSLLGIKNADQVAVHYLKGALFENLIINEFIKREVNRGGPRRPWFWQDSQGKEIDCMLELEEGLMPIEVKSGKTISTSYFDNLRYWQNLAGSGKDKACVVYGGDQSLNTSSGKLVSWRELRSIEY